MSGNTKYPTLVTLLKSETNRKTVLFEPVLVSAISFILFVMAQINIIAILIVMALLWLTSLHFTYQKNKACYLGHRLEMYIYHYFALSPIILSLSFYLNKHIT